MRHLKSSRFSVGFVAIFVLLAATPVTQAQQQQAPKELAKKLQDHGTEVFYKGDFEQAIKDYTQAIELDPDNSELFDNRCWAFGVKDRLQNALKDCEQSLRLRPNFWGALGTSGFVYLKLGQFDQAIASYNAALKLNPKSAYSLYGRGIAKQRIGDATGGNSDLAAAKKIKDVAGEMAGYGVR